MIPATKFIKMYRNLSEEDQKDIRLAAEHLALKTQQWKQGAVSVEEVKEASRVYRKLVELKRVMWESNESRNQNMAQQISASTLSTPRP